MRVRGATANINRNCRSALRSGPAVQRLPFSALPCLIYNRRMSNTLPLLKPREAAAMLGISYASVKQWILAGKLPTVLTPGGHHRIEQAALAPFLKGDAERPAAESRERFRHVSGRNQLVGHVLDVQIDGLLAKVVLSFGKQQITAIVTADAVREMDLKKGDPAAALVKATEVMIERV